MTTSERGMGVSELTLERLSELRRIAEAATPGPWRISDGRYDDVPADRFVIASAERDHIVETTQGGSFTDEDLANARHIAAFHPPTVLAMLDEIERLRREREVLAAVVEAAIAARDAFRLYDNPEKWHKAIAKLARVVEDLDPKLVVALDREEGRE